VPDQNWSLSNVSCFALKTMIQNRRLANKTLADIDKSHKHVQQARASCPNVTMDSESKTLCTEKPEHEKRAIGSSNM